VRSAVSTTFGAAWTRWGPWLLIAAGLALRLGTLSMPGTFDVDVYRKWGELTRARGLAVGFQGVYFPLQVQLFGLAAWLGVAIHRDTTMGLKVVNLVFDCGTLAVLIGLATTFKGRIGVLLGYWLNPWFSVLSILGYCDFPFAFFLTSALFIIHKGIGKKWAPLTAGCPLAASFLMKPQAIISIVALGAFGAFAVVRSFRNWRTLLVGVPSAALFGIYSYYFAAHGKPISFLFDKYRHTSDVMPCLTAHMLNVWYPIAAWAKPGRPDYALSDLTRIHGTLSFRTCAAALTLGLIASYAAVVAWRRGASRSAPIRLGAVLVVAFALLVVPMTMTGAHENHLFFGLLGVPFVCSVTSCRWTRAVTGGYVALVFGQTLNIVAHYGLGSGAASSVWPIRSLMHALTGWPSFMWICLALTLTGWFVVFDFFWRCAFSMGGRGERWAILPALVVVAIVGAVYAVSLPKLDRLRRSSFSSPSAEELGGNFA
jgi:hypothetical protein